MMPDAPDQPPLLPPPLPEAPPIWSGLTPGELEALRRAKLILENPGLAARLANALGKPIEKGMELLPAGASETIRRATKVALFRALDLAVVSLGRSNREGMSSERWHKFLVGASGGIGGVFGLAALPVELPVSTTIMLRSIADIARSEGHNVRDVEVKLSCLEVFALGGKTTSDDAAESSYWAVRAALAKALSEAVTFLTQRGVADHSAPAMVRLIAAIASKFGVVVSEQVAAKALPLIGAAGGSVVNVLFIDHFQDMARGHFVVKRLESRHGREAVRKAYEDLKV